MTGNVEVAVGAARDAVWRALTDPEEIGRWFGWEYDGLDEEIQFIFVDHATRHAPDRIELEEEQAIELVADGPRTVVRVVNAGALSEGWRTFLHQLAHYLEHHDGERRRTVYLTGEATPSAVMALLEGDVRRVSQRVALTQADEGLVAVESSGPLDATDPVAIAVTVTTYSLEDEAFAALRERWETCWSKCSES